MRTESQIHMTKYMTTREVPTHSVIRDAGGFEEPVPSQLVGMDAVVVSVGATVVVVVPT